MQQIEERPDSVGQNASGPEKHVSNDAPHIATIYSASDPELQQYERLRELLLGEIRTAHIRSRLRTANLEFIGCALRNRLITAGQAMKMLETPELLACFPEGPLT